MKRNLRFCSNHADGEGYYHYSKKYFGIHSLNLQSNTNNIVISLVHDQWPTRGNVKQMTCRQVSKSSLKQRCDLAGETRACFWSVLNCKSYTKHIVICCGSKNSSKSLFSRFQLIDSCHEDSSIKGRDFTEVIILSWHRCLSFVCQCFFLFV